MPQISLLHIDDGGNIRNDLKCVACDLCNNPSLHTNKMDGVGPTPCKFMFVGFAPAAEDDSIGRPMTGKGGRIFRELISEAGFDARDVFITNALKCCPYDTKVAKDTEFNQCRKHLSKEIAAVNPEVIITVGANPFHWLTGQWGVTKFRQQALPCKLNEHIPVVPIMQPAAVFHDESGYKTRERIIDDLRWIKRKVEEGTLKEVDSMDTDYRYAKSMTDVYAFLDEMDEAEIIAVDLETATVTGEGALFPEDGTIVVAIGFSTHPGHGRAIPLYAWGSLTKWYWTDAEVKEIVDLLTPRLIGRPIFGQNWLQHDQKWLKRFFGINRTNVVFDTMLAHYLIDEEKGTHDLEQLAIRYTKMPPWKKTFTLRDTEGLCTYLCKDVDATFRVKEPIEKGMTPNQKHLLKELLIPLGHELMEMELRGVAMNSAMVDEVAKLINGKIEEEMRRLREMPPVRAYEIAENTSLNVDDHKGLGVLMGDYFRFPAITTTPKGRYSTGKPTLEALKHEPFVQGVLKLRGLGKLKGTYVDGMYARVRKDGRIHTSYLQHGTATGRLSSQEPNLQNIPRKGTVEQVLEDGSVIKQIFQADPGYCFLQFDYSQIELRVLAMYSGDPKLIEIFESGKDIHKATAAKVYGIPLEKVTDSQRSCAKNVIFGVNYGMSEESLIYKFVTAGNTEAEAKDFLRFHKQEFSVTWKWIVGIERRMQQDNVLETFFGRKRHFEYIDKHALRQGPNFLIQSTASEFTLFSIVRTARALRKYGFDAYPLLTVHDNIVFQVKLDQLWEVATLVKHIMENLGFPFINVPVKVDAEVGLNWGKLKKINIEKQEVIGAKK